MFRCANRPDSSIYLTLLASILVTMGSSLSVAASPPEEREHFDHVVANVLASRCLECHRGSSPEGGLDLSQMTTALAGGDSGKAIQAGKPEESLLWQRIVDGEMPPENPLPEKERKVLRDWIAGGAIWGTDPIDPFRTTTDRRAGYDWWSLQPLADVIPPKVGNHPWPTSEIDQFVLAKLHANGLEPSPPASPRVFIRRLYVDLIGLPPTPEQVDEFVRQCETLQAKPTSGKDATRIPQVAVEELVDELLASPHYGERWARHWLDVARYGESDGFERNNPRTNLWPYRDWVINSLNADLPYDQFVRMQIAGDILQPGREGSAAVGFLVAGVHNTVVGSSQRMKLLARQDELEEIAGTVGQTFLGLTVNCARCHDHKFDPIRTEEYYSFIAALDGIEHGERDVSATNTEQQLAELQNEIDDLSMMLSAIDAAAREAILQKRKLKPQAVAQKDAPQPLASWNFDNDLKDNIGELHGQLHGGARIENGALVLDGRGAFVSTAPLPEALREKTLEAWVLLDNLDQRGGGVMSVQTPNGSVFDAIVFGEREPRRWMAGSDFFRRTQSFDGPNEATASEKPVHVAITYRRDGTITAYRNGQPYGQSYKTGVTRFEAGKAQVVFGMRHAPAGSNKMLSGRILRANLYDRALEANAVAASAGIETDFVSEAAIIASLTPEMKRRRADLKEQIDQAQARSQLLRSASKQKIYTVVPRTPGEMRVHIRGSVTEFGDVVAPSGISAVAGEGADFDVAATAPDPQRRAKLAEWIAHPSNPLMARVMVNRVWHYHFGVGLVATPSDFGFSGGQPSHPQLFDWLARKFREDSYSLKSLHRRIVLSATYQQASSMNEAAYAKDAGNRLLWRYSPQRIEGEVARDTMLQIAGVLNKERGGPGFEDVTITPNNGTTCYEPVDREGPQFQRRTIYRFTPRGGRSAVLDTLDCPDPSAAAPRRSVTTTPLQALSLLNNSFVLRMAESFAKRVVSEAGNDIDAQVEHAWQLALCRSPDDEEARLSRELIEQHDLATLCRALFNANEFVVIE